MATNQEGKHASFRAIAGTTLDYNGDSLSAFQAEGATSSNYNEAFIQWLQIRIIETITDLSTKKDQFAVSEGFADAAAYIAAGNSFTTYNPDWVLYLKNQNELSDSTLNGYQNEFALANGFNNWQSVNTISALP